MRPRIRAVWLALAGLATGALLGCGREPTVDALSKLRIAGSDTMDDVVHVWVQAFTSQAPGVVVHTASTSSSAGIAALIGGSIELAKSSRKMTSLERRQLRERRLLDPLETVVAFDAIQVFVHPSNPIPSLSLQQLREVFDGTIDNWSDLGGADSPIQVIDRNSGSGTREVFLREVLGVQKAVASSVTDSHSAMRIAVARDAAAIGFGSVKSSDAIRPLAIARRPDGKPVLAGPHTVRDGSYPISRSLYLYAVGEPGESTRGFLDFVTGAAGQKLVVQSGLVSID